MTDNKKTKNQLLRELQEARLKILRLESALHGKFPESHERLAAQHREIIAEFGDTLAGGKIGTWEYDVITGKVFWSKEMFNIHAMKQHEREPGWPAHKKIIHPDDWDRIDRAVQAAIATGRPYSEELRLLLPEGGIAWVLTMGRAIRNRAGKTVRLIGMLQDITERKSAILKLTQTVQRLDAHMDNSMLGIVEFDADYRVIRWSKGAEQIFGWSAEEILGRDLYEVDFVHREDLTNVEKHISGLLTGKRSRVMQVNRNYTRDGSVIICEWYNSTIYDADNNLVSIFSLALDITARRQAEDELKNIWSLLEQTERLAKVGGWEYDAGTGKIIWTDQVYRIYGVDPEEYDPSDVDRDISFYAPRDGERVRQAFRRCLETGEPYELEVNLINGRGETLWVFTNGIAEKRDDRIVRVYGNIMDITESKQAERALRESERHYRTLSENSPDIILRMDREFRYIYINPAIEEVTGIPASEFAGRTNEELGLPEENTVLWNRYLRRAFEQGEPQNFEFSFDSADGRRYFHSRIVPETEEDGTVKTVLVLNRDITGIVKIEKELQAGKEQLEEQNYLLERKNIALREMIQQVQQQRSRIQTQVAANVEEFILPMIERIKTKEGGNVHDALSVIEENLKSITSDFGEKVSDKMLGLTKREIEISNMIKSGLTSREISKTLGISIRGVETHRRNIRKKLGITNREINLSSYLSFI